MAYTIRMIKQLLKQFTPNNSTLQLHIDSHNLLFTGKVCISGTLTSNASAICLHVKDLDIKLAKINEDVVEFNVDEKADELELFALHDLDPGSY